MTEGELFLAALRLPDATARAAYLDQACGDDSGLRERVEALVRAHEQAGSFLNTPVVGAGPETLDTLALPAPALPAVGSTLAAAADEMRPFLAPPTRRDSLGRLGHYEVLQVLGRGAFGIVFRAFDDVLQRVVAVKVLAPPLATTSPARKRFLREARLSAAVRHENVVQVYAVEEQPLPYLVMEFVPGETLQQRLDRTGPLDPAEVVRIGRQVAEGLAAAHATDLIHRDIKPGNVLLEGGQLKVKITDFGLARAADDASLSQSGVIAGTPLYMAPEQAQGRSLDQRADLFSLGSVLYQMVTGRPPFRAGTTLAVLKRVAEDGPRPIREIIPEAPAWLCGLITRLHAKDPADRIQSARAVADLLTECEVRLKAGSRLTDLSALTAVPPPGRSKWKPVAAVVLLPLLAVALFAVTRPGREVATGTRENVSAGDRPSPDAEARRIAALPAAEQVEAVRAQLKARNPPFDGTLTPTIKDGKVVGLALPANAVTDLSPVRALPELQVLVCAGVEGEGQLADLSPLRGLLLTTLMCNNTRVADLEPLRGMPLNELAVQHSRVADLEPLATAPLVHLNVSHTRVNDLAPLQGMRLVSLYLDGTRVTDLTPLQGMPLRLLNCRNCDLRRDRARVALGSLAALEEVNSEPVAAFLGKLGAEPGEAGD